MVSVVAQFEETLTGFKWMGNKARDLQAAGACFVCCSFLFSQLLCLGFDDALMQLPIAAVVLQARLCCSALRRPLAFALVPLLLTRCAVEGRGVCSSVSACVFVCLRVSACLCL